MIPKQTLAEKYAEHQKRSQGSKIPLRELYNMNKSSSPLRRRTNFFDRESIPTRETLPRKAIRSSNERMPGHFQTPIKLLQTGSSITPLLRKGHTTRTTGVGSSSQRYRVHKNVPSQIGNSKGNGIFGSIWQIAKKFGVSTVAISNELSQLKSSITAAGNNGSPDFDIDSILSMRTCKDKTPLREDPVDESIQRAKELRSSQVEHRERLANTIFEEEKKREDLKESFEQISVKMAQELKKELRLTTDTIRDLTKEASARDRKISEQDIEAMEHRILKQNERFLTHKHELEAKLTEKETSLLQKEAALSMKEKDLINREAKQKSLFKNDHNLVLRDLEYIKREYDNECLAIAKESDLIRTSKKINDYHAKNIQHALEQIPDINAALFTHISKLLLESSTASYQRHLYEKGETFVAKIKDKISRCQEYIADYELELIKDPTRISDLYTLEALSKVMKCFEPVKRTIHTKLKAAKSKEENQLKIMSSSNISNNQQVNIQERMSTFVSNKHLLYHQEQLAGLLEDINELLKNARILEIRVRKDGDVPS